ncbi:serine/threonine-protein kinase [Chitinimonas sp. PSY-7]|uniref:protein kinase domain-containing protein n=1 Tax=Chitinimonas sp. PSY-7 TaxID=3459088 RepID=UPI00403FF9C3
MEKLGHYRIKETLGEGAMGVVYRAVDERLDRTVAIKVLRLHLNAAERAEYAARLQQEARSAARLNHAGIITMFDCGDENGHAYLAMEFVEGKTLQSLLDQGIRLPLNRVLKLADQLFAALAYAHENGVVHRDIKPANLMLKADGKLKITDFGIAQLPTSDLTRTGTIIGSPRHMAPEQIEGKKLDGRADIFAAGIVLYEVLTGKRPFDGDHMASIAYKILHEKPADIRSLNPTVPDWLVDVVMRCLEKAPEARFITAKEARGALREVQLPKTEPVPAPVSNPAPPPAPKPKPTSSPMVEKRSKKTELPILPIIAATAGVLLIGVGFLWLRHDTRPTTPKTPNSQSVQPAVATTPVPPPAPAPTEPPSAPIESKPEPGTTSEAGATTPSSLNEMLESEPTKPGTETTTETPAPVPTPATKPSRPAYKPPVEKRKPKPTYVEPKREEQPAPQPKPAPAPTPAKHAEPTPAPKKEDGNLWQKITGCDSSGRCPTPKKRETRDR